MALYGPENVFIHSNMPTELFAAQQKAFPEIFADLAPDHLFIAGHMGICKPEKAAFQYVITKIGVPASELLLIDDLVANVKAANELGMAGLVFSSIPGEELARWYAIIGFDPRFPSWGNA